MPRPTPPPETDIHRAARLGDIAALERLLAGGADVNSRLDLEVDNGPHLRGLTPLMVAARSIDGATVDTLRWLLDQGADLHATSEGGDTAAWYAAGKGGRWDFHEWRLMPDHADRLHFLLDAGLDPKETNFIGRSLLTEACEAGDAARVRLLIERGAIVAPMFDRQRAKETADGFVTTMRTFYEQEGVPAEHIERQVEQFRRPPARRLSSFQIPLFCAARSGSAECVQLLLDAGAPIDALDDSKKTALFYAGSAQVAELLLEAGVDLHRQADLGRDALAEILTNDCCSGVCGPAQFDVARVLVAAGADVQRGPQGSRLYDAAFSQAAGAVEFLLAAGADPHAPNRNNVTPLHAACWQGGSDDPEAGTAVQRIIDLLVNAGIDPDVRDEYGQTPMHEAAGGDWGNSAAIRALLRHGADPDPADNEGATPLAQAADHGYLDCIRLLLAAGADPLHADASGDTALSYAAQHLQSWIEINQENEPLDIGFYEPPGETERRNKEALRNAQECLRLLHQTAADRQQGV